MLYKCSVITSKCSSAISRLTSFVPHPPRGSSNASIFVSIFHLPKTFIKDSLHVLVCRASTRVFRHDDIRWRGGWGLLQMFSCLDFEKDIYLENWWYHICPLSLQSYLSIHYKLEMLWGRECCLRTAWEGRLVLSGARLALMTRWILVNIKYKEWLLCQAVTSVTIHHRDGARGN